MHLSERLEKLVPPLPLHSAAILNERGKPPVPWGSVVSVSSSSWSRINVFLAVENCGTGKNQKTQR